MQQNAAEHQNAWTLKYLWLCEMCKYWTMVVENLRVFCIRYTESAKIILSSPFHASIWNFRRNCHQIWLPDIYQSCWTVSLVEHWDTETRNCSYHNLSCNFVIRAVEWSSHVNYQILVFSYWRHVHKMFNVHVFCNCLLLVCFLTFFHVRGFNANVTWKYSSFNKWYSKCSLCCKADFIVFLLQIALWFIMCIRDARENWSSYRFSMTVEYELNCALYKQWYIIQT